MISFGMMAPLMFGGLIVFMLIGYPVAFSLAAVGLFFGGVAIDLGYFHPALLQALPERVFGIMSNDLLLAIPFFTFMGSILERCGLAEDLLEGAGQLVADFADGVWLVSLAPITDPALVASAIAQTLGLKAIGSRPLPEVLTDYLRVRQLLLVLDNCEQVIDAASWVADLLAAAPHLRVLATSREALRVRGEREFVVPPLTLPARA